MIRGYFDPGFTQPLPMLSAGLFLPGIASRWIAVEFLIDTGADGTTLQPADAILRLGIDPARLARPTLWPRRETYGGIGGSSAYYLWPAEYRLQHDDGHWQRLTGDIAIAQSTSANQTLESLLGWDLLQHFRVTFEWSSRTILLE